jgi:hypothetical protein
LTGLDRLERLLACLTNNGFQKNPFLSWFEYSGVVVVDGVAVLVEAGAVFHVSIRFFQASQAGHI